MAASQTASTDAARLWDLDTGNDHLASIPAGVMLQSSLHQNSGSVRGRLTYVRQAVRIAQSMGLFRPSIANSIYDPALPITTRGRATIAWAVYEHQRYCRPFGEATFVLTCSQEHFRDAERGPFAVDTAPSRETVPTNDEWTMMTSHHFFLSFSSRFLTRRRCNKGSYSAWMKYIRSRAGRLSGFTISRQAWHG